MKSDSGSILAPLKNTVCYLDGRPSALHELYAEDAGILLHCGAGPGGCDHYGARDVWVSHKDGKYYLTYDGAGSNGWFSCLATSTDLVNWHRHGPLLSKGPEGSRDSATATYGTLFEDPDGWHMHYLGSPNCSPEPNCIPMFPYHTLRATADHPEGPWTKRPDLPGLHPTPDSYCDDVTSPGYIVPYEDEFLQFFAASCGKNIGKIQRTLGVARTKNLAEPWIIDPKPILPLDEQIENASLYYQEATGHWFLFTNHVGIVDSAEALNEAEAGNEYTDAIWAYWTQDLLQWSSENRAVVLDGSNCSWSNKCIGLPSVVPVGDRLAIFYDAPGEDSVSHMGRHIGLAWLNLPIEI